MTLTTSILKGTDNNYETTSEMANGLGTDFGSEGVVGAITNTSGVAPMTGAFAVNEAGTPDMTVDVTAGTAYVTATPTGQGSQLLRVVSSATESVTINANSTGSTRYDWVYITINATNAAAPNSSGSNVASITTSRSTSASSDDGTPPTYGYPIAVVTVANGASSITNANITDKRANAGVETADGTVTAAKIADGAVTADKLATANYQVWREAATGTAETSGTSFTTAHSFATDMEIPTWATKVVLTWHVASLSVTSTTDGVFRLSLGTGDTTSDERVQFSTYPTNTVEHATFINEVTLSGTGTQSLTLQFREVAGSGAIRVTTSCIFHVKAEYY